MSASSPFFVSNYDQTAAVGGQPGRTDSGYFSNPEPENLMMQLGLQYSQKVLNDSERGFAAYFPSILSYRVLRRYFQVNNTYVKQKLSMLLFPFTKKFSREVYQLDDADSALGGVSVGGTPMPVDSGTGKEQSNAPLPIEDVRSFDLYLPLMALLTYVTICAFVKGLKNEALTPEYMGTTFSSIVFWLVIEVLLFKGVRYAMGLPQNDATWDLVALCGYKHVGVSLLLLIRELFRIEGIWYTVLILYVAAAQMFFAYKCVADMLFSKNGRRMILAAPLSWGTALIQLPLIVYFATKPF